MHPIHTAIRTAVDRTTTREAFLADPVAALDTNLIENRIKGTKPDQRPWLFAWPEADTEHPGIIAGLLAICQMQGIDPRVWLIDVLRRIDLHLASRGDELTPRRRASRRRNAVT